MAEDRTDFPEADGIRLTPRQLEVIRILGTAKSQKYRLGDWFLGAIYAAKNTYNPDRFSQAAQSLRELLEKLPRAFDESAILERHNFQSKRADLYSRLSSDKKHYDEGNWKGKTIDAHLHKTICDMDHYLRLNQQPTRPEQIHSFMKKLDPMHDTLDPAIRDNKFERFDHLWDQFQKLAHHQTVTQERCFWECLDLVELMIMELLSPTTAKDQAAIQAILSKSQPTQDDVEKLFELIQRKGANYDFFFKTVDNSVWITPLVERGFFKRPPSVEETGDGYIIPPLWVPMIYLHKVSSQSPERVVEIILDLKIRGQEQNPRMLYERSMMACELIDIELSVRLKPMIELFLKSPYQSWGKNEIVVKILQKWRCQPGSPSNAAYEILKYAISFQPDPKAEEKQSRRKDSGDPLDTTLEPAPRFDDWEYRQVLENGVRPLAAQEPYQVARILIDAVASMIRLGKHEDDITRERYDDYLEVCCPKLDKSDRDNHQGPKEALVYTLTYACKQVYEKAPDSIHALDQALRNQRWAVFKRLRQQLYASHLNEQTLPWIRELIIGYGQEYARGHDGYEFQLMIRKAAERFGPRLLSETERADIFDAILRGPSEEHFREYMGERYSEDAFRQRKHYFHRMQLRPFSALLSSDVRQYFDELEESAEAITDDSYLRWRYLDCRHNGGRSPKSAQELERLKDEDLLSFLNDWEDERRDENDWLVEINISALADAFGSLFKEKILSDHERLAFWMEHRDKIARPIYVASMVRAMNALVKDKDFGSLGKWIEFCAWVLSHQDFEKIEGEPDPRGDESRDNPDWGSSRRAVVDFIEACVHSNTQAPIAAREGIAVLLRLVCCQSDWHLDHDSHLILSRKDLITEALNNTRSRALECLISFASWVRKHLQEDTVPEVTDILSERTAEDAKFSLTKPEHALLGRHFNSLCAINLDWARALLLPTSIECHFIYLNSRLYKFY